MKTLLLAASLSLCSCASIVTGSTDWIVVTSYPQGAVFTTNFGHRGETPETISVPCNRDLTVRYRLEGYVDEEQVVETRLSGWVLGNILIPFGLVGLVVDLAGNGFVHGTDRVHAELRPRPAPPAALVRPAEPAPEEAPRESFEEWSERQESVDTP